MKVKAEIGFDYSSMSSTGANVDQNNQQSLDKWCLILGVTKEELLEAIKLHGNAIKDIRRGLRQKKKSEDEAA